MFLDYEVHLLQIDNKPVLPIPHHEATQDSLQKIIHEQHKQSSPRMDPCGTPYLGVCQDEVACSIHTLWCLPLMYVWNHSSALNSALPTTPNSAAFSSTEAHGQLCQIPY